MKTKNLLLLLLLASLWGPSFLFIKVAVEEIPPITLAALRIGLAALFINVYLASKKGEFKKTLSFWKHVTIAGFFAHAVPFVLINWGEMHIDSGLASILNGLTPLSTIVMAHFMVTDDKMDVRKVVGAGLGLVGLFVLILPSISSEIKATTMGILAVSLGAVSYGIAIVYSRIHLTKIPPVHAPASQLLATAIYLVPLSILIEGPTDYLNVSWQAMGSVFILAFFGTAVAFVVYYSILERAGASYLSLVTYLMPVYGVLLGVIFLNETLSVYTIVGAVLIVLGIMIVNRTIGFGKVFRRTKEKVIVK